MKTYKTTGECNNNEDHGRSQCRFHTKLNFVSRDAVCCAAVCLIYHKRECFYSHPHLQAKWSHLRRGWQKSSARKIYTITRQSALQNRLILRRTCVQELDRH